MSKAMRVFLAGATGAIGRRLVPQLTAVGHEVVAMTRSPQKAESLRAAGAGPVVADGLDPKAVMDAVRDAEPEVVVHQLTALSRLKSLRRFDDEFEMTNRLRTEGIDHLLAAAKAAGARRFLAQSFGGWPYARQGGPVKSEDDPLDPHPPKNMHRTLDAIRYLETAVAGARELDGLALRYGSFYGPGTSVSNGGEIVEMVRRGRFPIVGDGRGMWSFIHVDDAAGATAAAVQRGAPGVYNIVDNDPAPVSEWLPALADAVGAKPPRRVPLWLGRLVVGEPGVSMMTRIRGASNAKARRDLNWEPRYKTWSEGFRTGLG